MLGGEKNLEASQRLHVLTMKNGPDLKVLIASWPMIADTAGSVNRKDSRPIFKRSSLC
jgi:hypothetical protein